MPSIKADRWIKKMALEHGMIEPFEDRQVREGVISYGLSSYGYDIRVADEFKVFTNINSTVVDPKNFDARSFVDVKADVCIIPPNSFALAKTVEYFRIPRDVLTVCVGKSTYARCGLIVNVTPFEPEWEGLRDARDLEHDAAAGQGVRQRRASRRCCSSRATSRARSRTPTRRASTRSSRADAAAAVDRRPPSMARTEPARGMRDFLPEDVRRREYVIGIIKRVYERYGFEPLETPAVENLETLMGKYGDEGNQLIFKILKRGEHEASGQADLALRYDLTVPLARVIAHHQAKLPRLFKRYQIQPVWRADRPARGRFREFYQCDVDSLGSTSPVVEAELCAAVSDALIGARVHRLQDSPQSPPAADVAAERAPAFPERCTRARSSRSTSWTRSASTAWRRSCRARGQRRRPATRSSIVRVRVASAGARHALADGSASSTEIRRAGRDREPCGRFVGL